jgi:hypothetical protein
MTQHHGYSGSYYGSSLYSTSWVTASWLAPAAVSMPRMPRAGDVIRDPLGRVVGTWNADGTVTPAAAEVVEAVAAAETETGARVDEPTVKRAISLSGALIK